MISILRNKFNGMLQGLKGGGKDHRVWVSVVYNGPVPDGTEKLAFVSLVWTQGEPKSFPEEYTEAAIDCFDEPSGKIGAITLCRRKKCSLTSLQSSSVKLR